MTVPTGTPPGTPPAPSATPSPVAGTNLPPSFDPAAVSEQFMKLFAQNRETQERVNSISKLIQNFAAKEQVDFAKNFLDELTALKTKATMDLTDFADKYRTFAQIAREERNNADKELSESLLSFATLQKRYMDELNKTKLYTETEIREQGKAFAEALQKGDKEVRQYFDAFENNFKSKVNNIEGTAKKLYDSIAKEAIDSGMSLSQTLDKLDETGFKFDRTGLSAEKLSQTFTTGLADRLKTLNGVFEEFDNTLKANSENIKKHVADLQAETIAEQHAARATAEHALRVIQLADNEEKLQQALERNTKSFETLADKMLGSSQQSGIFSDSLVIMMRNIKANTLETENMGKNSVGVFKGLVSGIGDLVDNMGTSLALSIFNIEKAANRLGSFLKTNLIDSTFEFDKTLAQVNKTTGGFGYEFEKIAMSTSGMFSASAVGGLAKYGITLSEFGATYSSLANSMSNFNSLSDLQRKSLAENAATLEKLGVSAESYAKLTTTMMGALGKSTRDVEKDMKELANTALGLNVNVGKYVSEFEAMYSKLIGLGKEAKAVFKDLKAMSMATEGAATAQDLLTFAETFQQFESGASALAKFNQVFGATMDITDVMRKGADNPASVVLSLRQAIQASGQDIDKLNYAQKKFLAEAFGGDVGKMMAIFKMDLEKVNEKMNSTSATEKEREERIKKSEEAMKKFNAAIDTMKISLSPVLDFFTSVAEIVSKIADLNPFAPFLLALSTLSAAAFLAFKLLGTTISTAVGSAIKGIAGDANLFNDQLQLAVFNLQKMSTELAAIRGQLSSMPPPPGGGVPGAPMPVVPPTGAPTPVPASPTSSITNASRLKLLNSPSASGPSSSLLTGAVSRPSAPAAPTRFANLRGMGGTMGAAVLGSLAVMGISELVSYAKKDSREAAIKQREKQENQKRKLIKSPNGGLVLQEVPDGEITIPDSSLSGVKINRNTSIPTNKEDFIGLYGPSNGNARQILAAKADPILGSMVKDAMMPRIQQTNREYTQVLNTGVTELSAEIVKPTSVLFKPLEIIKEKGEKSVENTKEIIKAQELKAKENYVASDRLTTMSSATTKEMMTKVFDKQSTQTVPKIDNNIALKLEIPGLTKAFEPIIRSISQEEGFKAVDAGLKRVVRRNG